MAVLRASDLTGASSTEEARRAGILAHRRLERRLRRWAKWQGLAEALAEIFSSATGMAWACFTMPAISQTVLMGGGLWLLLRLTLWRGDGVAFEAPGAPKGARVITSEGHALGWRAAPWVPVGTLRITRPYPAVCRPDFLLLLPSGTVMVGEAKLRRGLNARDGDARQMALEAVILRQYLAKLRISVANTGCLLCLDEQGRSRGCVLMKLPNI